MKNFQRCGLRVIPLVWCAVFLLGTRHAAAICPPAESSRAAGGEPFRYALALAESFSYAKSGLTKAAPAESSRSDPGSPEELSRWMQQLRSAAEEYTCASELIAPYTASGDEEIQLSAQAAAFTYRQEIDLDLRKIALIQSTLDRKVTPANLAARLARSRVQTDETWGMLVTATVMATFALVQPPEREEERVSTLRITAEEAKTLTGRLERDFGPVVREGRKAGQPPLVGAAALLYGFVLNKDWETGDTQ